MLVHLPQVLPLALLCARTESACPGFAGELSVRMLEAGKLRESLQAKQQQATHLEEQQAAAEERIQVRLVGLHGCWIAISVLRAKQSKLSLCGLLAPYRCA